MGDLVLPSIHIRGYKAFRDFRLEKLGRVNLITGRNGTGKTAFLEAVEIYARRGESAVMLSVLTRDVKPGPNRLQKAELREFDPIIIDRLFFGRESDPFFGADFSIGQATSDSPFLTVKSGWIYREFDRTVQTNIKVTAHWSDQKLEWTDEIVPGFKVEMQDKSSIFPIPHSFWGLGPNLAFYRDTVACVRIPVSGLSQDVVRLFWDKMLITGDEKIAVDSLRFVNANIDGVVFVGTKGQDDSFMPMVRERNARAAIPLETMGEGLGRLMGLSCALVTCEHGVLLIDEIETGLHYSVQREMWRLIFETAKRIGVQVFASTHSADCAHEFSVVASEYEGDGLLTRLYRSVDGDIKATSWEDDEIESVRDFHIEVR